MGICLGWEQREDIAPKAWDHICAEFQKLNIPYHQDILERVQHRKKHAPFLASLLTRKAPLVAYQVDTIDADRVSVLPSPKSLEQSHANNLEQAKEFSMWSVTRQAGENWSRQGNHPDDMYQSEMLLAFLILVERWAPGNITITQDDYETGCWTQTLSWMSKALQTPLRAPHNMSCQDLTDTQGSSAGSHPRKPK